jgi:SPP1 gp7 family putative phage head morphogenesis protein
MATDPKPPRAEVLRDRAVRHQIYVRRVGTQLGNEMLETVRARLWLQAEGTLAATLRRARTRGQTRAATQSRALREAFGRIDARARETYQRVREDLRTKLAALAAEEAKHQVGLLRMTGANATLRTSARSRARAPWQGGPLSAHLELERQHTLRDLRAQVQLGVTLGESDDEILRRVVGARATPGLFDRSGLRIVGIGRGAAQHATSQAREAVFDSAESVAAVQWIATLDSATCPRCAALDGEVFPIGEGPRPPLHIGCEGRCTTIGVIHGERPARTITYPKWLASQPAAVQDDVLGRTRGRLFRSGELTVDRFVDSQNRVLNLDALRAREPDAFEAAGL